MFLLCFLHFFSHLIFLLHYRFIISFPKYLCLKFIKAFKYLIVQEADLGLNLLHIETLRELLPNVLPHLIDDLRVHAIVVRVVEATVIEGDLHSIIDEEGIFVWVIEEKGWVVEGPRD